LKPKKSRNTRSVILRLFDTDLELRTLFSILNGEERVRQRLLAKVNDNFFGYPVCQEILGATIRTMRKSRKRSADDSLSIPSSRSLQEAPGISVEAKTILKKPKDPVDSRADVDELLRGLEFYRKIRVVHKSTKRITSNLRGSPDKVDLEFVRENLIKAVEGTQDYDAGRSITILRGKAGRKLAKNSLKSTTLIPTGFKNYDERGGGASRGDLIICAAPTSQGKSIMLLTIGVNFYLYSNLSVCIASYELSKALYNKRLIAHVSGIDFERIRKGKLTKSENRTIHETYDAFMEHGIKHNCQFALMEPGDSSAEELGLAVKPHGFDVVIPDHLNHLRHVEGDREDSQLGMTARRMKKIAEHEGQIWVTATQLDSESQRIRYSRMIAEESDTGWAWVCEEGSDVVKIKHLKARHTSPFDFYLQKDFEHMSFRDSVGPPTLSEKNDKAFLDEMEGSNAV
jgi:hypothetical protein